MPLVNCPDCKSTVSDAAPVCINCGRPMTAPPRVNSSPPMAASVPPGAAPTKPRWGVIVPASVLGAIAVLVLLLGAVVASSKDPKADVDSRLLSASLLRPSPQVLVDEELAVGAAGGYQTRGFVLTSPRPVRVAVEGRKDADKGFKLYLIPSEELPNLSDERGFKQLSGFQGLNVRTFAHTEVVPAGSWTVVVMNTENIMNTLVAHLKVIVNPE